MFLKIQMSAWFYKISGYCKAKIIEIYVCIYVEKGKQTNAQNREFKTGPCVL